MYVSHMCWLRSYEARREMEKKFTYYNTVMLLRCVNEQSFDSTLIKKIVQVTTKRAEPSPLLV